jgi:hypothetical protein
VPGCLPGQAALDECPAAGEGILEEAPGEMSGPCSQRVHAAQARQPRRDVHGRGRPSEDVLLSVVPRHPAVVDASAWPPHETARRLVESDPGHAQAVYQFLGLLIEVTTSELLVAVIAVLNTYDLIPVNAEDGEPIAYWAGSGLMISKLTSRSPAASPIMPPTARSPMGSE